MSFIATPTEGEQIILAGSTGHSYKSPVSNEYIERTLHCAPNRGDAPLDAVLWVPAFAGTTVFGMPLIMLDAETEHQATSSAVHLRLTLISLFSISATTANPPVSAHPDAWSASR